MKLQTIVFATLIALSGAASAEFMDNGTATGQGNNQGTVNTAANTNGYGNGAGDMNGFSKNKGTADGEVEFSINFKGKGKTDMASDMAANG